MDSCAESVGALRHCRSSSTATRGITRRPATRRHGNGREHLERTDYIVVKQKQEAEKAQAVKERAEAELKAVKGELKTERLKNSAAEVGTTILDGIGAMIGTSKAKRQEQEIDRLQQEVAARDETIETCKRRYRRCRVTIAGN